MNPEIRIYDNPQTLTYEASIKSSFLRDYYLTMSNIDRSDYYNIKFQKKPLMIWIWISVVMIVIGGFLRIFTNAKATKVLIILFLIFVISIFYISLNRDTSYNTSSLINKELP